VKGKEFLLKLLLNINQSINHSFIYHLSSFFCLQTCCRFVIDSKLQTVYSIIRNNKCRAFIIILLLPGPQGTMTGTGTQGGMTGTGTGGTGTGTGGGFVTALPGQSFTGSG